ncbi:MAG: Cytochrome c553 [Rhodobacteraceae bacterium HLUCCA12]|nr:MAG: Cytochrome c553 [Rhodobacteraceae bacterium HLUCCA12]
MRDCVRLAILIGALAMAAPAVQAQQPPDDNDRSDEDAMPAIASICLSCHGTGGRPALEDVPIIAGQQPRYLRSALLAYSTGRRTGGQALVMQEIVKTLSEDDIDALADWFGGQ